MWEAESTRCWTADVPKIQKCTGRLRYHGQVYSRSQWQRRFRKPCRKIGLPLERVDSEVVDLVFAMEDMERGLQEMAQSVEHMQEMLKRSPMVQALAQHKPEVRAPSGFFPQEGTLFASRTRPTERRAHAGSIICLLLRVSCQHGVCERGQVECGWRVKY